MATDEGREYANAQSEPRRQLQDGPRNAKCTDGAPRLNRIKRAESARQRDQDQQRRIARQTEHHKSAENFSAMAIRRVTTCLQRLANAHFAREREIGCEDPPQGQHDAWHNQEYRSKCDSKQDQSRHTHVHSKPGAHGSVDDSFANEHSASSDSLNGNLANDHEQGDKQDSADSTKSVTVRELLSQLNQPFQRACE